MNLDNIDLMQLLPLFMRGDEAVKALAESINPIIINASNKTKLFSVWDKIDVMPEKELDELAWELDIAWYDSTADISIKRDIIKKSDMMKSKLGTKWAVEQLINTYFGSGRLLEWFEYGGKPYYFKVISSNTKITDELANQFISSLNATKNTRSWLEKIEISMPSNLEISYGIALHDTSRETYIMRR